VAQDRTRPSSKGRRPCVVLGLTLAFVMMTGAASCRPAGDEASIREMVKKLVRAAGERDTEKVLAFLAGDYEDFQARSKDATRNLVQGYFDRYRGLAVHTLSLSIEDLAPGESAAVGLDLVLTNVVAEVFTRLADASLDLYRFRLDLRRDASGWLITGAAWKEIGPADLLPGSDAALRELFPRR
jgi:hypothetical protein